MYIIIIRHGHFFIVSGIPIQTSDGKDFSFEQSNQEIGKTFLAISLLQYYRPFFLAIFDDFSRFHCCPAVFTLKSHKKMTQIREIVLARLPFKIYPLFN